VLPKPADAESLLDRMIHTSHKVLTDWATRPRNDPGHGLEHDPETGV